MDQLSDFGESLKFFIYVLVLDAEKLNARMNLWILYNAQRPAIQFKERKKKLKTH